MINLKDKTYNKICKEIIRDYNVFRKNNKELDLFLIRNPDIEGITYQALALQAKHISDL